MRICINVKVNAKDPIKTEADKTDRNVADIQPQVGESSAWFDESCAGWMPNPESNKYFLLHQQNFFNEKLKAKGYLFENEVRDSLGLPRTQRGQIVGWTYNKSDDENGCVDLGIFADHNRDFFNGLTDKALLNFNVDGDILQYL